MQTREMARTGPPIPLAARPRLLIAALTACLIAAGCDRSDRPPPPPPTVSLTAPDDVMIEEADNRKVPVTVRLDRTSPATITVQLNFSGSATRGRDYAVGSDALVVPSGSVLASTHIDVYRDFDAEADETIAVGVESVNGNALVGSESRIMLTVLDGEAARIDKQAREPEPHLIVFPERYSVTGDTVELGILAINTSPEGETATLTAEWSTDFEFHTDVHSLGFVDVPPVNPDMFHFPETHGFTLPLDTLEPNGRYFVRAYLSGAGTGNSDSGTIADYAFLAGFLTDASGSVVTRCTIPERNAPPAGADPLFVHQWHLSNTGQTAFSNAAGLAGADLRMTGSIGARRNGAGVKIAVVDTGLEICHPDLAANVAEGQSFNFAYGFTAGASRTDPFNHGILGDHGTSVAGVAAAAANNGRGGRGVAPEASLVGFNVGAAVYGGDAELAMFQSLGGSDDSPDSASVDIFNMSFGTELPAENSSEDFVRLVKMGTGELRSGKGALYIKAAGNDFEHCHRNHPLNEEVGCIGANADPDHNLPYLIAVGAFNAEDIRSSYSSAGATLWVVGPAGEDGVERPAIITTDQAGAFVGLDAAPDNVLSSDHPLNRNGDYTSAFGGTSSATPAVAGAVAVLLGAYPALTWRDVKHILASSARQIDPGRAEIRAAFNGRPYIARHRWQTNAAGYRFHNWYGFGAVAVDDALETAASHAPDSLGEFMESPWFEAEMASGPPLAIPDADGGGVTDSLSVAGLPESSNIEAVILEISADHSNALDLGITLRSPSGAASIVNAPFNALLDGYPLGLRAWRLMSNAFYGENPNGTWTVHVADLAADDTGQLGSWRLRFFYGEHP